MGTIVLDLLVPGLMAVVSCAAMAGKRDVYSLLVAGASEGLTTVLRILPALIVLMTSIHMLRASGAMEFLTKVMSPICQVIGIPPETVPLVVIRPISGSAALAVGSDIMSTYGVDSEIGRTAAVMLGSTETTFYTISVYFGAANIKKTRYAIPAALLADFAGFWAASLAVKMFF